MVRKRDEACLHIHLPDLTQCAPTRDAGKLTRYGFALAEKLAVQLSTKTIAGSFPALLKTVRILISRHVSGSGAGRAGFPQPD